VILNTISNIKPLLQAGTKVIITTHHKPDADALGSSLGLWGFLQSMGTTTTVISPTDYGDFLKWMPGEEKVLNFEMSKEQSAVLIAEADLIFCLDFNALKRINQMGELVSASKAQKVLIDHHLEPEQFADFVLWSTEASSTCELVYVLIEQLGELNKITKEIASCLYAGIMTDTASFKHNSTKPSTHKVASALLDKGAQPNIIFENIYDNYSFERTRFIGYCLYEKMQVLEELHTAIIMVTADELKKFNIITGDTEGLVNYGLSIKGIKLSVLIVDRTVLRKMSFRSKGDFPANEFARKYFNGGGHFNAAGGESNKTIEEVEKEVKQHIQSYKHILS
jgi:phosphoesterase RecJ-like protein